MQSLHFLQGNREIPGLLLMSKMIKNNPARYLRRADLASARNAQRPAKKTRRDFLTASIDQEFYIDFSTKARRLERSQR